MASHDGARCNSIAVTERESCRHGAATSGACAVCAGTYICIRHAFMIAIMIADAIHDYR